MMTTDVKSIVLSTLADHCAINETDTGLTNTMPLAQLRLDSLELLELVYDLEEQFSVTIESSQLQKLITVGDLVHAIDSSIDKAA